MTVSDSLVMVMRWLGRSCASHNPRACRQDPLPQTYFWRIKTEIRSRKKEKKQEVNVITSIL